MGNSSTHLCSFKQTTGDFSSYSLKDRACLYQQISRYHQLEMSFLKHTNTSQGITVGWHKRLRRNSLNYYSLHFWLRNDPMCGFVNGIYWMLRCHYPLTLFLGSVILAEINTFSKIYVVEWCVKNCHMIQSFLYLVIFNFFGRNMTGHPMFSSLTFLNFEQNNCGRSGINLFYLQ